MSSTTPTPIPGVTYEAAMELFSLCEKAARDGRETLVVGRQLRLQIEESKNQLLVGNAAVMAQVEKGAKPVGPEDPRHPLQQALQQFVAGLRDHTNNLIACAGELARLKALGEQKK